MSSNNHCTKSHCCHRWLKCWDFLPLLAIRLYLVPVLWISGTNKWNNIDTVIAWFGHDLGFPYPVVMAYLAACTEIIGAICLLFGFAVRWVSIPLMILMIVAAVSVHWHNGWYVIAQAHTTASDRLADFMNWLHMTYPDRYTSVTEFGQLAVLNNGIQFAVTFLIMLMVLFFFGGGKYFSIDYWIKRRACAKHCQKCGQENCKTCPKCQKCNCQCGKQSGQCGSKGEANCGTSAKGEATCGGSEKINPSVENK